MATAQGPFSLYVHIPYCGSKCPYCDFNSHVVPAVPEAAYTDALVGELDARAGLEEWRDRAIQTVFFGGGTPSLFRPQSIARLLERAAARFGFLRDCEITLEANPGTVDPEKLRGYRNCGINRISLGAQSFQPRLLRFLGRTHTAEETEQALAHVERSGFENFSLDLIYAVPGQTLEELDSDLRVALSFRPPHLSAYNLTIEEGTPFHRELAAGRLRPLGEEEEIEMADRIEQRLGEAGLLRYEISNYARPGFESRHNLNYWRGGDYLGLGAGAHSFARDGAHNAGGRRWWNEKSPARYIERVAESGFAAAGTEESDPEKAAGEFVLSGLRLSAGISLTAFSARFGKNLLELRPEIPDWIDAGFMEVEGDRLRLTRRGLMVANSLFVHFV
ncbi:MAG TPA: radical SAM family heme chaperone HemW [candidate division Zixibacteria bacterium]|nr:radical SAM family heme chaperone HemW [candidate division Zixibacteria bacterium]